MIQNTIKLTSDSIEFACPTEVSDMITAQALEEISQQLYDVMDISQKSEWDDEEHIYKQIEEGKVIEVTIDWPDNLDETNIKHINVRTGCVNSLEDLKALIIVTENLAKAFVTDDEDCCCCC